VAGALQPGGERGQVARARHPERGVRLARRGEGLLDPDVQLLVTDGEPHAAARS
jgi:hypothetical protein